MTPDQDIQAKQKVHEILEKFISDDVKVRYPSKFYELHYTDLINANNIYRHLDAHARKEMADKVFDFLTELSPIIISTSINKLQIQKIHSHGAWHLKQLAMRFLLHKFSMYLTRHQMVGTVVYDEEESRNDVKLRNMMHSISGHGAHMPGFDYQQFKNDKLENILNTVQFCPSELSPGIQYADFIARSVWQHHEKHKSDRYNEIASIWERAGDSTYGDFVFTAV